MNDSVDIYVSYCDADDKQDNKIQKILTKFKMAYQDATGQTFTHQFGVDQDMGTIRNPAAVSDYFISHSQVALVIGSSNYLRNGQCLYELKHILVKHRRRRDYAFIINLEEIGVFSDSKKIDEDKLNNQGFKYALDIFKSYENLEFDSIYWPNADYKIDNTILYDFCGKIHASLESYSGIRKINEIEIVYPDIENKDLYKESVKEEIFKKARMKTRSTNTVCIIYTGGTIGMIQTETDEKPAIPKLGDIEIVKNQFPAMRDLPYDIHFYAYEAPLDSSNITVDDWNRLAAIIKILYSTYSGFVIMHGANTLAYTASALSFIFQALDKPIILTGSELPLSDFGSDAEFNFISAINAAGTYNASYIKEVCIMYGGKLLRGNRTTKKRTLSVTDGFYSPNYDPLGELVGTEINLKDKLLRRPPDVDPSEVTPYKIKNNSDVYILDVYPNMDIGILDYLSNKISGQEGTGKYIGIILRTYGTGNAPDKVSLGKEEGLLGKLEELIDRGKEEGLLNKLEELVSVGKRERLSDELKELVSAGKEEGLFNKLKELVSRGKEERLLDRLKELVSAGKEEGLFNKLKESVSRGKEERPLGSKLEELIDRGKGEGLLGKLEELIAHEEKEGLLGRLKELVAHEKKEGLLGKLKKLIDMGVVVVNLSQCPEGRVELRLFETGSNLFDIGVLNGGDMTTEALYAKMKYWLSQLSDGGFTLEDIKNEIQRDNRGELTYSVHTILYDSTMSPYKVEPSFLGSRVRGPKVNPKSIQSMVLRIKKIKPSDNKVDNALHAKVYLNAYESFSDDHWVGTFRKEIGEEGIEAINIELNDKIRKILRATNNSSSKDGKVLYNVSIRSVFNDENDGTIGKNQCRHFTFESLQLTIFTKDDIF